MIWEKMYLEFNSTTKGSIYTRWFSEILLLSIWHYEWMKHVGEVGVSFNDAVALEVFVSRRDGLVKRATRFYRRHVFFRKQFIVAVQRTMVTRYGVPVRNTTFLTENPFCFG